MIIFNVKENKAYNMDNMISIGAKDGELNCKTVRKAKNIVIAKFASEYIAEKTLIDILFAYSIKGENLYCIYDVD